MWKQSALRSVLLGSTWRCCWMQTPSTACWVTQSLWTSSRAKISSWKGSSCWSCQASSLQQRGNGWSSKECIFSLHDWEELKKKKKIPHFHFFLSGIFMDLGFQISAEPWRLILKVCCWATWKVAALQGGDRTVCSTSATASSSGNTQPSPSHLSNGNPSTCTVNESHLVFPAVPGLDTSPCLTAQTMSPPSTKNFANLTSFYPNWSVAPKRKVSLFSISVSILLVQYLMPFLQQGKPTQSTHPGNDCGSSSLLIGWAGRQGQSPGNRATTDSWKRKESTWKCRSEHHCCSCGSLRWVQLIDKWNRLLRLERDPATPIRHV